MPTAPKCRLRENSTDTIEFPTRPQNLSLLSSSSASLPRAASTTARRCHSTPIEPLNIEIVNEHPKNRSLIRRLSRPFVRARRSLQTAMRELQLIVRVPSPRKVPADHVRVKKEPITTRGVLRWRFARVSVGRLRDAACFHPVLLYGKSDPEFLSIQKNKPPLSFPRHRDGGYKKARILDHITIIDAALRQIAKDNLDGLCLNVSQPRRRKPPHWRNRAHAWSRRGSIGFVRRRMRLNVCFIFFLSKHRLFFFV